MAEQSEKELRAQQKAAGKARIERAKQEAKEARQAAKKRRATTTNPREMGRLRQIREAYKMTHEYDPALPWLLAGAFVLPIVVLLLIGLLAPVGVAMTIILVVLGMSLGLLAATLMLTQRTKRATYKRYEGEAGSAEVALNLLGKKWTSTPALVANKHKDVIHRTVGRSGIFLIGEGDPNRVREMLVKEQRKHEKFTEAPVHIIVMGERSGQVPLSQLSKHLKKQPKLIEQYELDQTAKRLQAIDNARPRMPMPKGPMPTTKGSRRAMRG